MRVILNIFLFLFGIGFLILFVGIGLFMAGFGGVDKDYSVTELKENFEEKRAEIYEVKNYINKIIPPNKLVHIEFENNNMVGIFHLEVDGKFESNWDVKINSNKADSLLQKLGWTTGTLKTLKEKLDNANCIGITSGEPCNISFQRSGMGMYSFNVFDRPIADSLKARYNDGCTYIMVNDRLVLEYGGGAIGSQCFYNLE
ncbi:hypothetical protein [Sphingobacterium siyangense]|jgi:hypothetical protein|uniref:Lipoprotein n=1 Tax=Sphingobacterium multivorum TaxID=28454 RepID=A0ABX7CGR1_SPHMU|nr:MULTISPECIES: hypothetical protein [Sphingobacterium]QQT32707.1 hypothetical protein I6I99_09180 [Sphingobacterium multivorum]QQT51374.1 hypothetical protein I6I98_13795 [Sphingobacterium multivorum]QRY56446.1 hypothetical protein JVX97_20855 [Sphingobacterium siyangense]